MTIGSRRGSLLPRQVCARRAATAAGAPPKQAKGRLGSILRVGHLHAVLGHQDTAGGGQQRVPGDDVVRIDRAQRDGRDAIPDRDPGQPVRDRRQRHEPGEGAGRAVPDGSLAGAMVEEHHICRRPDSRWLRSIATGAPLRVMALPSAQAIRSGPRSGLSRGEHHAQNRRTLAQQPDRDRAAAPSFQERARAVMRIDDPAIAVRLGGQNTLFLADELGRQQRRQTLAQKQFDLGVDRRGVVVAEPRTSGRLNSAASQAPACCTRSITAGRIEGRVAVVIRPRSLGVGVRTRYLQCALMDSQAHPSQLTGPLPAYQDLIANGSLAADPAQAAAVERLQDLWERLRDYDPEPVPAIGGDCCLG